MTQENMDLNDFLARPGAWLGGRGPQAEIVISSRVRLARNLACHRFAARVSPEEKAEVARTVQSAIENVDEGADLTYFDVENMSELDRQFLLERHLISREHMNADGPRGVAIDASEHLSVMVNEEDHLRLQALQCGLQLDACYAIASQVDDALSQELDYAFDADLGYLTACPTNIGTGLRVSVMLHLPALVLTQHIERAFRAVQDMKLAVRGLYGEGTEAYGEFYQISNQITIGRPEEDIIADLGAFVEGIIAYETKARERLQETESTKIEDRIWRSYATLQHARVVNSEEALRLLSSVRLGVQLGILPAMERQHLNQIFLLVQPGHLQRLEGRELSTDERDVIRATYIRSQLAAARN